ncbi:CD3324 family protein [Oceanirhabdus seepicola]|uniref:Mor transcription activator domain-containing protein n=1 Tax=Oceanirhabdus seepicola TaxID=2828781 RepID=A0A9J6NZJ5_9CLOT|nr:CD3324 family protein [Oceanirhabdus seepicola]MCM1989037.1 hypothetical protein [Oceanirhabdus seepicola]
MQHIKAKNVLPKEIIDLIQEYIDGEYIYIPRKEGNEKSWGQKKGTRHNLKSRNIEILNKHNNGVSVRELAKQYHLAEKSISRIIRQEKKLCA